MNVIVPNSCGHMRRSEEKRLQFCAVRYCDDAEEVHELHTVSF